MQRARLVLVALLLGFCGPAVAEEFPPISDQERALTSVSSEPNAPAVVLFRKAEFVVARFSVRGLLSSRLIVRERIKILTDSGKQWGEASIPHSSHVRLESFAGRTVLPDGRLLPVTAAAKFERKVSRRRGLSITAVAFPGVEVGAILDRRYELKLATYLLEPWYFADEIPVLFSEIVFKIPPEVVASPWSRDPFGIGLKTETVTTSRGTELRAWAENLPSVPDDPYGPPFGDLALKMMMVPRFYKSLYLYARMFESWPAICKAVEEEVYAKARRKNGGVPAQATSVAGSSGSALAKAQAVYRFVRDEIATEDEPGIFPKEGSSVQKILAERRGNSAEKALLLDEMLAAVGVDARLAWAGDRRRGQIDLELPNPDWFDRALVLVLIDGQVIALDPSDRALPFGKLQYGYEGTPAVVHDPFRPRQLVLAETRFEQNVKRAVLELALDAEGRLAGTGELVLTGHPAVERVAGQEDRQRTLDAWKKWLAERYRGFEVADVQLQELLDEWKVRLAWSLRQRDEDVLGDEISLTPSLPLGPVVQPFVQPADKRRSEVQFPYGFVEEVELRLRWPEGWKIESVPAAARQESPFGALAVEMEIKEAERTLAYRRRFEMRLWRLGIPQDYEAVRALFGAAETSDGQMLVVVRQSPGALPPSP